MSTETTEITTETNQGTPVLPLRDVVVYPHMVIPLFVGREKSIKALDQAMQSGKQILLIAQQQADVDDPGPEDLYAVGTVANILQLLKLPDGTVKVLVEGAERANVADVEVGEYFSAHYTPLLETDDFDEKEVDVLSRAVVTQFEHYVKLNKKGTTRDPDFSCRHRTTRSIGGHHRSPYGFEVI